MRLLDIDTLKAVPSVKPCGFCVNARVDDDLTDDNDFSSMAVGSSAIGYRILISSGFGKPVRIEFDQWNRDNWSTVGRYYPKYCPECGRKLDEYEEAHTNGRFDR